MAPSQHLDWFEDNISWFENLSLGELDRSVPNCPGWRVQDVLNHLSFGLGLAYPAALLCPPDTPDVEVFADVEWPTEHPDGSAAVTTFGENMRACLAVFRDADPYMSCWTYGGPGVAGFWFRRAAIETALHRMDVEDIIPESGSAMPEERVVDALIESVEFALPFAAQISGAPDGHLTVRSPELVSDLELGRGSRRATVHGAGTEVLRALWGRSSRQVTITGDQALAADWLARVELAFANR